MPWQRVEKTEFGYAVQIPDGWTVREPDLRNSPWATAHFGNPADRRHSVIVFRVPTGPGRTAAEVAERAQAGLDRSGFVDFTTADAEFGGRPAIRLECARHDAGRTWAVREFFVVHEQVSFCLGCGSSVPEEDEPLFTEMARTFEFLAP
jgi:hypothetical protein